MALVHRHTTHWRESDREEICPTVCGLDYGDPRVVEVVFAGLRDDAVTCPDCLRGMAGGPPYYVVRGSH